jgi:hypothetical protein
MARPVQCEFLAVNSHELITRAELCRIPARGDTVAFETVPGRVFTVAGCHTHISGEIETVTVYLAMSGSANVSAFSGLMSAG